jgi:hypothetical protein
VIVQNLAEYFPVVHYMLRGRIQKKTERKPLNTHEHLNDDEIRISIARMLGWKKNHRLSSGSIVGETPGIRWNVPLELPNWAGDIEQSKILERTMKQRCLMPNYLHALHSIPSVSWDYVSSQSLGITARQRCYAVLIALEGANLSQIPIQ